MPLVRFVIAYKLYIRIRIWEKIIKKTNTIDFNIYIERTGKCLEEKYTRRFEVKELGIYISREILTNIKKKRQ